MMPYLNYSRIDLEPVTLLSTYYVLDTVVNAKHLGYTDEYIQHGPCLGGTCKLVVVTDVKWMIRVQHDRVPGGLIQLQRGDSCGGL